MLNKFVKDRATGKTTEVISRLRKSDMLIALVSSDVARQFYPKDIRNRVFTLAEFNTGRLEGVIYNKMLIDEGFNFPAEMMVDLYYELGRKGINVDVYGTIYY